MQPIVVLALITLVLAQMPSQAGRVPPPAHWRQIQGGFLVYWLPPTFAEHRENSVITPGSVYRSDDTEFRYFASWKFDCNPTFADIRAKARAATYEQVAVAGKQAEILHFDDHEGAIYGDASRPYCAVMLIDDLWCRDSCLMMHVLSSTRSGQADARRIFLSFILIEGHLNNVGDDHAAQLAVAPEPAQRRLKLSIGAVARAR